MSDKRTLMEHIFCTRHFAKCQMPSVFYKEDVFWKQCGMFYKCSGKRTASSSVSVTGSKVREDFTNEMTFDLEEERYSEALCQCLLNMSESWVTASRLGWWQHGVHGGSAVGDEVKLCDATVEERKCSSPAGTGLKALRGRFSAYEQLNEEVTVKMRKDQNVFLRGRIPKERGKWERQRIQFELC